MMIGLYFILFSILQFCYPGNHPQGDLVMFDYRLAVKVEIY
jgi:hypothetical protein